MTKRFTSATHFFLGLALAIAPVGAWIAQTGRLDLAPLVLAAGVICWVAGFDLIYATQDYDFDRREGIRSLVVKLGITRSLRLAQLLHLADVCRAHRFWIRRGARRALLLVAASDRGGACLRAQNRKTRSGRNQSRVFPEQRVCERGVLARGVLSIG